MGAASDGIRGHQSTMRDEVTRPSCRVYLARVRGLDKKNRALAGAIAELRGHSCQGPGLRFDYTLSWLLRKAPCLSQAWQCGRARLLLHIKPRRRDQSAARAARSRNRLPPDLARKSPPVPPTPRLLAWQLTTSRAGLSSRPGARRQRGYVGLRPAGAGVRATVRISNPLHKEQSGPVSCCGEGWLVANVRRQGSKYRPFAGWLTRSGAVKPAQGLIAPPSGSPSRCG